MAASNPLLSTSAMQRLNVYGAKRRQLRANAHSKYEPVHAPASSVTAYIPSSQIAFKLCVNQYQHCSLPGPSTVCLTIGSCARARQKHRSPLMACSNHLHLPIRPAGPITACCQLMPRATADSTGTQVVHIKVNGVECPQEVRMKLGSAGEAYFVQQAGEGQLVRETLCSLCFCCHRCAVAVLLL